MVRYGEQVLAVIMMAQAFGEALTAERERIAADLHDGPVQSLAALQWRLEALERLIGEGPTAATEELATIRTLAADQSDVLRGFLANLRQERRDGRPLGESLAKVRENFEREGGPRVKMEVASEAWCGSAERNPDIVNLVQEALANVRKHAHATCVKVTLRRQGPMLALVVHDNGRGLPMAGTFNLEELEALDAGPKTICRRVRRNGGALELETYPGQGAILSIKMPV
jgi:signal transduction histidine kinase